MPDSGSDLENRLVELWWQRQSWQWEIWALGADRDLNALDERLYKLCAENADMIDAGTGRAGELLRRRAARILVDCDPDVAACRNAIDRAFFGADRKENLSAAGMREPVLELMRLRNQAARGLGSASYPALVFWEQEVEFGEVQRVVDDVISAEHTERSALTDTYGMHSLESWFGRLKGLWPQHRELDVHTAARALLRRLGVERTLDRIRFEVREGQASGFVAECEPEDIRLFVRPSPDPALLFHELGHAVGRASNEGAGVYRMLSAATDEAFGEILEHVAFATPEVERIFGSAAAQARQAFHEVNVLENARLAASFTFEMALWSDSSNPEGLYRRCYAEAGMDVDDEEAWPLDSFRSLDPVYVQNYVIARALGTAVVDYLQAEVSSEASPEWGRWLATGLWRDGARGSLREMARRLGPRDPFALP
jgi:hypothetical protein